jgi:hypothetical protein
MSRYPDGMSSDDWARIEGTGKYAEDYDAEAAARDAEGPDPDDERDRRRERDSLD